MTLGRPLSSHSLAFLIYKIRNQGCYEDALRKSLGTYGE
jgi:hypothetical protein